MDISMALSGVRTFRYRHSAGRKQLAQEHLRGVFQQLPARVPLGMKVLASGAGQSLPVVPWIAILDPSVTTTAQEGLYVVYLYRADLSRVYLSMNQGATQHLDNAKAHGLAGVKAERAALEELRRETELIRTHIANTALDGLLSSIDLGASRFLPHGYEEGNIAAIEYDPTRLPGEDILRRDLARFLALYDSCITIKNEVLIGTPGLIKTAAGSKKSKRHFTPRPPAFHPKSSSDYRAQIPAHTQDKGRLHEALLNQFYEHVKRAGLVAANNVHPCDLTVENPTSHWLVEAKTVGANAEHAVREAIGQLFAYRHFYYRDLHRKDPILVALFSQPIGDALVELLISLKIEAIWRDSGEWCGHAPAASPALLAAAGL